MASCSSDLSNVTEVRETLFKIQKNLECPICLELLSDPYTTQCSHPFCRACICKVISASKVAKCPLCKVVITKRSLTENRRLGEIVEAVKELEQSVLADSGVQKTPPRVLNHTHESTGTPGMIMHSLIHPTPIKPGNSSREGSEPSRSGKTFNALMIKDQPSTSRDDAIEISTGQFSSSKKGPVIKRRRKVQFNSNKKPSKLGSRTSTDTESVCTNSQHRRELLEALEGGALREASQRDEQRLDELEATACVTENREQNVVEVYGSKRNCNSYVKGHQLSSNELESSDALPIEDVPTVPAHSTSIIYKESAYPPTSVTEIRSIAETPHLEALPENELSLIVVKETPFVKRRDGETINLKQCSTDRETPLINNNTVSQHAFISIDDPTDASNLSLDSSNLPQDTAQPSQDNSVNPDILARETQLFSPPPDSLEPIILAPTQPSVVTETQPTSSNLSDSNTQESSIFIIENMEQSIMKENTVGYCRPDEQNNPSTAKSFGSRETHSPPIDLTPSGDVDSSLNIPLQNIDTIYSPSSDTTTDSLLKTRGVAMVPPSQTTPLLNKTTVLPQLNQCFKPATLKPSIESNTSLNSDTPDDVSTSASSHSPNTSSSTPHISPELTSQELETLRQLMADKEREVLALEAMLLQEEKPQSLTTTDTTNNIVRESPFQTISENVKTSNENGRTSINTIECSNALTKKSQEAKKDDVASSIIKSPVDSPQVIFETQFTGHSHEDHTATEDECTLSGHRECAEPEIKESMRDDSMADSHQVRKRGHPPVNMLSNNTEPCPKRTKSNDTNTEQELSPKTKRTVQLDSDDIEDYSLPSPNKPLPADHPFMSVSTINQPIQSQSTSHPNNKSYTANIYIDRGTSPNNNVQNSIINRKSSASEQNKKESKQVQSSNKTVTVNCHPNSPPKPQQDGPLRLTTSSSMLTTPQQGASCSTPQQRVVVQTPALSGGGFASPGGGARHTLSLVGSGLSKSQLRQAQRFARTHNGRIASVFNCHTTHVVVSTDSRGLCPRTVKYLQGVLARIWVLSYHWVEDSVREDRLLPEEHYEVNGDNTLTSSDTSPRVPAKARLSRLRQEPGLFSSRLFYLHCDFNGLSKDQLSQLLCLGGGEVVECVTCDAVTVCDCVDRPHTITSSWLLDCISSYRPL